MGFGGGFGGFVRGLGRLLPATGDLSTPVTSTEEITEEFSYWALGGDEVMVSVLGDGKQVVTSS